jgi:hypothetical protein
MTLPNACSDNYKLFKNSNLPPLRVPGNPVVYPADTPRAAIHITKEIPHKTTRTRGRPHGHPTGPARGGGEHPP